jgi:predicted phosphodiesterase
MTGNLNQQGSEITQKANRVGVISDIHGNYQALKAVLEKMEEDQVELVICCGDVVGYGACPNDCVELLKEKNIPTIAGNHDHAALLLTDISNFNEIAKAAVLWTKKNLTEDNIEFLRQRPLTLRDKANNVCYVHASPREPGEWHYILTMGEARTNFNYYTEQICFIGHSHQPFIIENDEGNLACPTKPEVEIRDGCRYLINVGSVGQPRDHNPRACYVVVDFEKKHIEIKRCDYDLDTTQKAIVAAGLPRELSERLAHGM